MDDDVSPTSSGAVTTGIFSRHGRCGINSQCSYEAASSNGDDYLS